MKGLRAKEIRGTEASELTTTLQQLEADLFKNRLKQMTNQLENTMVIRQARRSIARVRTVLAEKLRQQGAGATAQTAKKG